MLKQTQARLRLFAQPFRTPRETDAATNRICLPRAIRAIDPTAPERRRREETRGPNDGATRPWPPGQVAARGRRRARPGRPNP
eukprot:6345240-Alexandrium_andersonii.AAC.1